MILEDGFFLSHTSDTVEVPAQKDVDAFLPPYRPRYKLDPRDPHTYNIMADPSLFISFKHEAQKAMNEAKRVVTRVDRQFKAHFGRGYGCLGKIHLTGSDVALLTIGTAASTAIEVVKDFRKQGKKVGLCRLRMFRPFPSKELCKILEGAKKVAVLDRDNSLGAGGIVAQELKAALFNLPRKPKVFEFIAGLGGKDITPETIQEILEYTIRNPNSNGLPMWIGVQK